MEETKEISVGGKQNVAMEADNNSNWYYLMKNEYNHYGDIYNIDQEGNLLAKVSVQNVGALVQEDGINKLDEADKEKIKEAIDNARKQIDFVYEQEKLKEEIKGYPEFNEKVFQLYDSEATTARFKNQKSLLRALFQPNGKLPLKILLSITALNREDYFEELLEKKVYTHENLLNMKDTQMAFDYIKDYYEANNKLPSLKSLVNFIGLHYSKEFFDEYLFDEQDLEYQLKEIYKKQMSAEYRQISESLRQYDGPAETVIDDLTNANDKWTLPTFQDSFDDLQEYVESKKGEITLSSGIKELENQNFALYKGKISTVFAYTGSFKTMFCSNTAYNIINNGGNVLYISLEVSKSEMYINFLSRHSYNFDKKISHSDIKTNRISDNDKKYLFDTIYPDFKDRLKDHLIVYDETDISINSYAVFNKLLSQADKEFIKNTGQGIDLIIIDHLNLLKFSSGERTLNDYSAVNHWMSYFRKNCMDFLGQKKQVAILCACQSSREGYKKAVKNNKYDLTSIAEGNEIERSSQFVLSIFTTAEDRKDNLTQMQILKARDDKPAETDTISIGLDPKYYAFGVEGIATKEETKDSEDEYADVGNHSNAAAIDELQNSQRENREIHIN